MEVEKVQTSLRTAISKQNPEFRNGGVSHDWFWTEAEVRDDVFRLFDRYLVKIPVSGTGLRAYDEEKRRPLEKKLRFCTGLNFCFVFFVDGKQVRRTFTELYEWAYGRKLKEPKKRETGRPATNPKAIRAAVNAYREGVQVKNIDHATYGCSYDLMRANLTPADKKARFKSLGGTRTYSASAENFRKRRPEAIKAYRQGVKQKFITSKKYGAAYSTVVQYITEDDRIERQRNTMSHPARLVSTKMRINEEFFESQNKASLIHGRTLVEAAIKHSRKTGEQAFQFRGLDIEIL